MPSAKGYEQALLSMHITAAIEMHIQLLAVSFCCPNATHNGQLAKIHKTDTTRTTLSLDWQIWPRFHSVYFHIAIFSLSARHINNLHCWFHNQSHQIVLPFYPSMLR
jgi:hypothetical protein